MLGYLDGSDLHAQRIPIMNFSRLTLCGLALICNAALCNAGATAERPNFLFLLVDDLGWADVSCNGSTFYETPHIDALAESGVRFTHGYAAASVCSPTRASIMTGRHPVRVGITDWIPGHKGTGKFEKVNDRDELALEEVTIAEALNSHGYRTFFAGKWHLGQEGFHPEDQGFDVNIGGCHLGGPAGGYYAPWRNPKLKRGEAGEYLTEYLTEESIRFLQSAEEKETPFLLYLSYYNVHTPIQAYKKRLPHYEEKAKSLDGPTPVIQEIEANSRGRQDNPELASMVAAVDDSVGAILQRLGELGLDDNTVVIFFSDNGGLCTRPADRKSKDGGVFLGPGCNLPLRAGKGWLYEGGIREATIIRAPGITQPGGVCESPVVSMDFFPTILELAGLPLMPNEHCDGESLVPLLANPQLETPDRTLCWHYPHYHGSGWKPGAAIRRGNMKLIEFWEHDEVRLFDLGSDPGERNDLSDQHPEIVTSLRQALSQWRTEIGAEIPPLANQVSEEN